MIELLFTNGTAQQFVNPKDLLTELGNIYSVKKERFISGDDQILGIRNADSADKVTEQKCASLAKYLEKTVIGTPTVKLIRDIEKEI